MDEWFLTILNMEFYSKVFLGYLIDEWMKNKCGKVLLMITKLFTG
jgi:hypothetical protein